MRKDDLKRNYKILIVVFLLNLSSCFDEAKVENGQYSLSHAHPINDENVVIPMPENQLLIQNDSILYSDFEPYILIKRGMIKNNYILFENGDRFQFTYDKSTLKTYDDSLCYIWFIRK